MRILWATTTLLPLAGGRYSAACSKRMEYAVVQSNPHDYVACGERKVTGSQRSHGHFPFTRFTPRLLFYSFIVLLNKNTHRSQHFNGCTPTIRARRPTCTLATHMKIKSRHMVATAQSVLVLTPEVRAAPIFHHKMQVYTSELFCSILSFCE